MIGIEVRASHLVTAYAVGIIADSSRRLVPRGNRRILAVGSIPSYCANQKTKALSHKLSAFLLVEMIGIEVRASHLVTAYAVGIIADSSRRLVPRGNRRIFAVGSIP